ncbi:hypothetical protein ACXR2T_05905 [Leucobacter sp. HY1910]
MASDKQTREAWQRAALACAAAAEALREAGIAPEALAEYVPERGTFLWRRKATMQPLGEAWRLGTLLLGGDGALYAHGHSTRAAERGRPSFQSESREERREIAAAALRGGYAVGSPVSFDAVPLMTAAGAPTNALTPDLDPDRAVAGRVDADSAGADSELPIGLADGEVRVRWRAGAPLAGAQTLAAFLTERVDLLVHPPFSRD